jgi:hypothetical protein
MPCWKERDLLKNPKVEQNKLHSEFRTGYVIQILITVVGFTAGSIYVLVSDMFGKYDVIISIFLIIFGTVSLYFLFLRYLIKISVDDKAIHFKHLMTRKETHIPFDKIRKIDIDTFQIENVNGPLTEAIPEINIVTDNNSTFFISPGIYGNFHQLVLTILQKYNSIQDERIEKLARQLVKLYLTKYGKKQ